MRTTQDAARERPQHPPVRGLLSGITRLARQAIRECKRQKIVDGQLQYALESIVQYSDVAKDRLRMP